MVGGIDDQRGDPQHPVARVDAGLHRAPGPQTASRGGLLYVALLAGGVHRGRVGVINGGETTIATGHTVPGQATPVMLGAVVLRAPNPPFTLVGSMEWPG